MPIATLRPIILSRPHVEGVANDAAKGCQLHYYRDEENPLPAVEGYCPRIVRKGGLVGVDCNGRKEEPEQVAQKHASETSKHAEPPANLFVRLGRRR